MTMYQYRAARQTRRGSDGRPWLGLEIDTGRHPVGLERLPVAAPVAAPAGTVEIDRGAQRAARRQVAAAAVTGERSAWPAIEPG